MISTFIISVFVLLTAVAIYFVFRPRRSKVNIKAFAESWREILNRDVDFYKTLPLNEKQRFEDNILTFLNSVKITGVETEVTDQDRLLVASSAIIPLFGYPDWKYRKLNEVLLYKTHFNHDYETEGKERNVLGMVGEGPLNRMMILSKPELIKGFTDKHAKSNVGIHEFVHILDKADGSVNGVPNILMKKEYIKPWLNLMYREIDAIKSDQSDINPYGATNEAEFLSVISEYFFERPQLFKSNHPELFELLEKIYRQDLA